MAAVSTSWTRALDSSRASLQETRLAKVAVSSSKARPFLDSRVVRSRTTSLLPTAEGSTPALPTRSTSSARSSTATAPTWAVRKRVSMRSVRCSRRLVRLRTLPGSTATVWSCGRLRTSSSIRGSARRSTVGSRRRRPASIPFAPGRPYSRRKALVAFRSDSGAKGAPRSQRVLAARPRAGASSVRK